MLDYYNQLVDKLTVGIDQVAVQTQGGATKPKGGRLLRLLGNGDSDSEFALLNLKIVRVTTSGDRWDVYVCLAKPQGGERW